jgi:hypothetical protein
MGHNSSSSRSAPAVGCALTTLRRHSHHFGLMASSSADDNGGCGGGTEIRRWSLARPDVGAPAGKATAAAEARLCHSVWMMRRERLSHLSSIIGCKEAWEPSTAS